MARAARTARILRHFWADWATTRRAGSARTRQFVVGSEALDLKQGESGRRAGGRGLAGWGRGRVVHLAAA